MMEGMTMGNIYVVVSVTDQSDYAEPRYYNGNCEHVQPSRENQFVSNNYAAVEYYAKKQKLLYLNYAEDEKSEYTSEREWEPEEYTAPPSC